MILEHLYLYILDFSVRVYLFELILNGWTDFYEIFCLCFSGNPDGLDLQYHQVYTTRRGAQTRILRFTLNIIVYKWSILVT